MGVRKLWFPIALAVLWVVMTAMAISDFASFSATTRPMTQVVERPLHSARQAQGRAVRMAMR